MFNPMEMSLDEIIKASGQGKRSRAGGKSTQRSGRDAGGCSRGGIGGVSKGRHRGGVTKPSKNTMGPVKITWKNNVFNDFVKKEISKHVETNNGGGPTKIQVSNLHYEVSNSDMQELFSDIGPLRSAAVLYDNGGRSLGIANIAFERRTDAFKAIQQYNGVPLDGRAMIVQMKDANLKNRLGGGAVRSNTGEQRGGKCRGVGRGRNNGPRGRKPVVPTVEQLNADLDAYARAAACLEQHC